MSFDPKTNTVFVDNTSASFLEGSGQQFILTLKKVAEEPNAPRDVVEDWAALKTWLDCKEGDLTEADYGKIGTAWLSYLASGIPPSLELAKTFGSFPPKAIEERWKIIPIPDRIRNVFDRMLASKEEVERKNAAIRDFKRDRWPNSRNEPIARHQPFFHALKERSRKLTSSQRAGIVLVAGWGVYVVARTSGYYEFLGISFEQWDSDAFCGNLLLPPGIVAAVYYAYLWVFRKNA